MLASLSSVSDPILLEQLEELVSRDRTVEVDLLRHLGEVEARGLHLELGFPSMFAYCTEALGFSESTAYHRIQVARAARRIPAVLERLRRGEIHLAGVKLLAPHLTRANHVELLDLARHKSKRAIEELLADRAPKPDAPAFVRRMPPPVPVAAPLVGSAPRPDLLDEAPPLAEQPGARESEPARPPRTAERRTPPEALGQDRFKIQFTADRELRDKLREAQALLRHQVPDGDLATLFDRALTLLVQEAKRKRFAQTSRAVTRKESTKNNGARRPASRHIPAEIKRAVAARDQSRCAYVSRTGRRCDSRDALEFHHTEPWARSKCHALAEIELRCRAHNQHAAVRDFGAEHMARCRSKPRAGETEPERVPGPVRTPEPTPGRSP